MVTVVSVAAIWSEKLNTVLLIIVDSDFTTMLFL